MKLWLIVSLLALGSFPAFGGETLTTDARTLQIRDIGKRVRCQCGCSYTVAECNMLNCHFREPVNEDIRNGLEAGLGADQIIENLIGKYGAALRVAPRTEGFGAVGWAMPFVALALGLAVAPLVVRRWRRNQQKEDRAEASTDGVDSAAVARHEERLERELAELD